jgi:hypothetical protein
MTSQHPFYLSQVIGYETHALYYQTLLGIGAFNCAWSTSVFHTHSSCLEFTKRGIASIHASFIRLCQN